MKRRLAGVNQYVSLQVAGLGERLVTSITGEWFLSTMGSCMGLQFTWSLEDSLTDLTVVVHGPQWSGVYWLVSRSNVIV